MDFGDFWHRLLGNVPFLLMMLPLFGAALVAASAGLGAEAIRRTALTNVVLTCSLSVVMVVSYDRRATTPRGEPDTLQMVTRLLPWLGGDGVRDTVHEGDERAAPSRYAVQVAVGVDGLSLWPMAVTCWLMVVAVLSGPGADADRPAAFYTALLTMHSALVGALAAIDVVLFLFCLEAAVVPLWYLVGRWGRHDRRAAARRLLLFQTAGSLLVFAGLMGLVVTAAARGGSGAAAELMFLMPRVLAQPPAVAGWIAAALVLGFWTKLGLFPLHAWFPAAYVSAPASVRIVLTGAVLPLGGYGLLRFVLPLTAGLGPVPVPVAGSVQAVAIAGALYFGLLALAQSDLTRLLGYAALCHFALAAAGVTSANPVGATGGSLHFASAGLTMAAFAVLVGWLERRYEVLDVEAIGGFARGRPRTAIVFTLVALALIGLPGLSGFAGLMLILWGTLAGAAVGGAGLGGVAACLAAWLLCAWAIVAMLVRTFVPTDGDAASLHVARVSRPVREVPGDSAGGAHGSGDPCSGSQRNDDLTRRELVRIVPLAVLIVWIGVWPRFFTSRIEPTLRPAPLSPATAEESRSEGGAQ